MKREYKNRCEICGRAIVSKQVKCSKCDAIATKFDRASIAYLKSWEKWLEFMLGCKREDNQNKKLYTQLKLEIEKELF